MPIVGALKFSEEVLEAKAAGKPLVALESTIITHGMPYPHNLETARKVEDIIRARVSLHRVFILTNCCRYIPTTW